MAKCGAKGDRVAVAAQADERPHGVRRRRQSGPSRTHGKDARKAKQIELDGWDHPRHLAGRMFSVVVHGDAEGAENVRRNLVDRMRFMHMVPGGVPAELDRYMGYWGPYTTSHDALDRDQAIQEEVRNAARTLLEAVQARGSGIWSAPAATWRRRARGDAGRPVGRPGTSVSRGAYSFSPSS
jgi:hypothetical protein